MRSRTKFLYLIPNFRLIGLSLPLLILLLASSIVFSGCGKAKLKGLIVDDTAIEEPPPAPPGFAEALTLSPSQEMTAEPDLEVSEETEDIEAEEDASEDIQAVQGADIKEDVKLDTDLKKLKNIKENSQDINKEIKRVESQAETLIKKPANASAQKIKATDSQKDKTPDEETPKNPSEESVKKPAKEESQAIPETVIKLPVKKDASSLKIDSLDPPP